MRNICAVLLALAVLVPLAPRAAHAGPSAGPQTLELEVVDRTARGTSETLQITITLGERGCSSVETRRDPVRHKVIVCREGGDAAASVLSFNIERQENTREVSSHKKLQSTARMAAGQRMVVGRVAHSDGANLQVAATLR
jgi:hypothetical protein